MLNKKQLVSTEILSVIEEAIDNASSQEEAIELASYYGSFTACNFLHLYDGGHLELKFIEHFGDSLPKPESFPIRDSIHVISSALKTGGHTRLMERLAGMHENAPDLLITCKSYVEYKNNNDNKIFYSFFDISELSMVDRLRKSISILSRYKKVILHIHPNDFVAAIAARMVKKNGLTNIFFVNHADHVFSFGRTAADCILEVSAFGEALGKIRCPGLTSSFIGIPLPSQWGQVDFYQESSGRPSILASGSSWKFKPELGYSLQLILKEILEKNKSVKLTILGSRPLRDYWWWSLKLRFPKRVSLRKSIPFEQYKKILKSHTFVIDSFPVPGGTAFPEALIAGKIVLGIEGPVSGYSPIDRLRVTNAQAIESIITNSISYEKKLTDAMRDMECIHGMLQVKRRYLSALAGQCTTNLMQPYFRGDPLFFEKYALKAGRINMPRRGESGSISVSVYELTILFKFFSYLSLRSVITIFVNVFRLLVFHLKRIYL